MADGVEGDRDTADDIGSVAEEAAKLFGALSGWARDHGLDETLATGAPECTYCPICRAVHAVRECSPEVRQHLVVAAASLIQAASAIMTAVATPPDRNDDPSTRRDTVEHIDLDAEWEDD